MSEITVAGATAQLKQETICSSSIKESGAREVNLIEVVALPDLYAKFQWLPPEILADRGTSNLALVTQALAELRILAANQEVTFDVEKLTQQVIAIRKEAIAVYKKIYPDQDSGPHLHGVEPYYHGIGSEDEWTGHVDFVLAMILQLFVGIQKTYQTIDQGEMSTAVMNDFLGENWAEAANRLNLEKDLLTIIKLAVYHEVGEWWIKKYWGPILEEQRQDYQLWANPPTGADPKSFTIRSAATLAADWRIGDKFLTPSGKVLNDEQLSEIEEAIQALLEQKSQADPDHDGKKTERLAEIEKKLKAMFIGTLQKQSEFCLMATAQTTQIAEQVKAILADTGLEVLYDPEKDPTEFSLVFTDAQSRPELLAFLPKLAVKKNATASKAEVMATLLKAADYLQASSPQYWQKTDLVNGRTHLAGAKMEGPLLLLLEFLAYKPGAAKGAAWKGVADTGVSQFFYEQFLAYYALRPEVAQLLGLNLDALEQFKAVLLEKK